VPDRVTAINAVLQLRALSPSRVWRLVEVDIALSDLERVAPHLIRLLHPKATVMDFNIGAVLLFAAHANGRVCTSPRAHIESPHCRYHITAKPIASANANANATAAVDAAVLPPASAAADAKASAVPVGATIVAAPAPVPASVPAPTAVKERGTRSPKKQRAPRKTDSAAAADAKAAAAAAAAETFVPYRSTARVLLSGIGADELMGGYGRHRTTFRAGGAAALAAELALDFGRLWRRNLGRDDRVIGDASRELRCPYLDERVAALLLDELPLSALCDLSAGPSAAPGIGDKRILRAVCTALGLPHAATLQKRAMQFGTRIANRHVAGYVRIDPSVSVREMVLATAPPATSAGEAPAAEDAEAGAGAGATAAGAAKNKPRALLCKKANKKHHKPGFAD
jgi:hypothetical protein